MSETNALPKTKSNVLAIQPAEDYKLLFKWGKGKRVIPLAKVVHKAEGFFSKERARKLGVSFDPYLLFDLPNNEVSICGCSNEGTCPIPDVSPTDDNNQNVLCFQAPRIESGKFGIKISCLREAVQNRFGKQHEKSVCLWLNIPPNVVAQLILE